MWRWKRKDCIQFILDWLPHPKAVSWEFSDLPGTVPGKKNETALLQFSPQIPQIPTFSESSVLIWGLSRPLNPVILTPPAVETSVSPVSFPLSVCPLYLCASLWRSSFCLIKLRVKVVLQAWLSFDRFFVLWLLEKRMFWFQEWKETYE